MNKLIKKMTMSACLLALTYVLTTFVSFPTFNGQGYLNFGDAIVLFSAFFLGPWWTLLIATIAGMMADLTLGAIMYIPFTIVAKGLEAIIAGLLFKALKQKIKSTFLLALLSFIPAVLALIATYALAYILLFEGFSGLMNVAFDAIQGAVAIGVATPLCLIFKKVLKQSFI